jgi:SnoaL-like domain
MHKRPTYKRRLISAAIVLLPAGIALSSVLLQAQQSRKSAVTLEALAAKVQQLEDVQEITNVLVAYGRALDSRDFKAYSNLFARDGSWSGGMGTVSGGPQAIYDFMTSRIGGGRRNDGSGSNATAGRGAGDNANRGRGREGGGGPGSTYHIMSNFKIDVNGDGATASSHWTFVSASRGPGIQVAGRYEDRLVREDGVWKFKSRQAFNDVTAPAASPAGGGAQSEGAPAAPPNTREQE